MMDRLREGPHSAQLQTPARKYCLSFPVDLASALDSSPPGTLAHFILAVLASNGHQACGKVVSLM